MGAYFAGMATILFVFILTNIAHFGYFNVGPYCGSEKDLIKCSQQWLSAIGPTLALIFAAAASKGLRDQIIQGQESVNANKIDQVSKEHEALSLIRFELFTDHKELEEYENKFKSSTDLAGKVWEDLETMQFNLDGYYEWLGDKQRSPYLIEYVKRLRRFEKRADRREIYRCAAASWKDNPAENLRMYQIMVAIRKLTLRDMDRIRQDLDGMIAIVRDDFAALAKRRPRYLQNTIRTGSSHNK